MKHTVKDRIKNVGPNIDVDIRIRRKDTKSVVRAIAVASETGVRIGDWRQKTVPSRKQESTAIDRLCNMIAKEYTILHRPAKKSNDSNDKNSYWSQTIATFSATDLCDPAWAYSTQNNTLKYLTRQVLPRMDSYGEDITDQDMASIRADLITKAIANGRSKKNPEQAQGSVDSYLYRVNFILCQMSRMDPTIPQVLFPLSPRKNCSPEQAKSIPDATRVKIAALMLRMNGVNGLALAVAMMMICGLRTAEAAAVKIGEIMPNLTGDRMQYVVYFVSNQIQNRERVDYLKTNSAYRIVVGTVFLKKLISDRIDHLRNLGYTDDQIVEMPLSGDVGSESTFPNPNKISAFGKELLLAAGYTNDAITAAQALMVLEPDLDADGKPCMDVTAYIYRRDWCSRACNICGMEHADVDYLIGHATDELIKDYTSRDVQCELAEQLENYVFLPDYSLHRRYKPLLLSSGREQVLPVSAATAIRNDTSKPMRVRLTITSREPGTDIKVIAPRTAEQAKTMPSQTDTPEARRVRQPLGRSYPREYYVRLQIEASSIQFPQKKDNSS